jgi:hydrophobic/amphiphilic exporter-1 (mainly G- bacteria), HAE1 family
MKKLAQFAVDYPISITMAILAVALLGYISFSKLGMDLFPDLNNPRIFVELKSGERPPEEMERQFVQSIESQAIRQKGVVNVSSISTVGSAQVTVEYSWNSNMDEAFLDLQKTLKNLSANQQIDELNITQHDPNASPIILLGFSHPEITDMDELRRVAENFIQNELVRQEGIAEVKLLGKEEKEVLVETDDYLMKAYGINPSTLASKISNNNRNVSGGSITESGKKYVIKGVSELDSIDDIGRIIVAEKQQTVDTSAQGTSGTSSVTETVPVYLKDVATIKFQNKKPDNIVRVNGVRCMGIAIYKETKYNTIKAVNEFVRSLDDLRKALPGYQLTIIQNQGDFVTQAVSEVKSAALIGILLSVLVLFIFLRRFGTTAIISLAIPISIIATFNLMYFDNLTMNIMTLGGLALGAGMLVDNAIIVMENIFRNLETGMPLKEAAVIGTSQVGGAINASTITTIVVFLPIVYLHGSAGELFKDQALTVAFSLMCSLAVAIFVIPMLAARFLRNVPSGTKLTSIRFPGYRKFLSRLLDHRWLVIGVTVLLVAASFSLIPHIGSEFMPKPEAHDYSIDIKLPEGTEITRTAGGVETIESIVRQTLGDNIKSMFSVAGPSEEISTVSNSVFQDENTATVKFSIKKESLLKTDYVVSKLTAELKKLPGVEAKVAHEQTALDVTLGTETAPLVVDVQGEDLKTLQDLTEQVKEKVSGIPDLFNIETSFDEGRPEIDVVIDRVRAGVLNVGIDNLTARLKERLSGTTAGQWDNGGELRDITIELPKVGINDLENILIQNGSQNVAVNEVAGIAVSQAPKEIYRKNQVRIGMVTANLKNIRPLNKVVAEIRSRISGISFPQDYKYDISGEEQMRRDAFQNLKFAFLLSLVLMYMVLASQFESLIHPFTILLSIPTALIGTIVTFFILGKSFNMMAYIGLIMLVGIAVNDSIILVDCITQLRNEGASLREAILEAGQRRIRPIIMTSLTAILGMLPLCIGIGEGAALRAPLALAVVGGLFSSTLLTLIVIPCVYSVLDALTVRNKV